MSSNDLIPADQRPTDLVPATPAGPPASPPGFDDEPAREIRLGAIVGGLFFVLFLGWASFAPLDAGAYASGVVVVSGNRQSVQYREGGTVSAIHVKEGDQVAKGQVLIEISAADIKAQERALAAQVIALQAQKARLVAERDGLPVITTPAAFMTLSEEDRLIADEAMRIQVMQLNARRGAVSAQRSVLNQRIGQLSQQISGFDRQRESNTEQQRLIQEELDGMRKLESQGYAPKTRVRALERAAAGLTGEDGAYRAEAARAREAIGEARMEMVGLDRRVTEEVIDLLRQTEVQLGDLEPKLTAARQSLARAQVRAPEGGEVVGLTVFTVGGVVQPGQTLMEIVPRRAPLVIEAMVSPNDADDLRIGQETEVRFTAFRERDLPILKGRITKISADSFVDEQSGERYFKAEVNVPPEVLAELKRVRGEDTGLRPGLPVEVVVPLRERTALQYLTEPLQQMMWRSFREH